MGIHNPPVELLLSMQKAVLKPQNHKTTNKQKHLPNKNPAWLKVINKPMDQIIIISLEYSLMVKDFHGLEARVQSEGKMSRVKETAQLVKYLQNKRKDLGLDSSSHASMAAGLQFQHGGSPIEEWGSGGGDGWPAIQATSELKVH